MKFIALATAALALTVGTAAQAQTLTTKQASMRAPVRMAPAAKTQTKIVYRTIIREVPVQPQAVLVQQPVTRWVPSILPPFSYPVTTYENRLVYTTPGLQTVDADDLPIVRTYAPASSYAIY